MLDSHGFDLWAGSYDDSVRQAAKDGEYPFAGYPALMNAIYGTVMRRVPASVLDVGVGTAVLAKKLYDAGCAIAGLDFSAEMLALARRKMPDAHLILWDFTRGIPPALEREAFDCIVSTYALHHLPEGKQAEFILALLRLLKPEGAMLIGDVCFPTREALSQCRDRSGDLWDEEENYLVFENLRNSLSGCRAAFHAFSFCCGVIEIERGDEG